MLKPAPFFGGVRVGLSFVNGRDSMLCLLINGIHFLSTACWLEMLLAGSKKSLE
jgi:hypothetical protein